MKKIWLAILVMLFTVSYGGVGMAEKCCCSKDEIQHSSKNRSKAIVFCVESVEKSEAGDYITVFDSKQDLFVTITPDACKDYQLITTGTKLRLWYEFVTMSLPARTNAVKAKIIKK